MRTKFGIRSPPNTYGVRAMYFRASYIGCVHCLNLSRKGVIEGAIREFDILQRAN